MTTFNTILFSCFLFCGLNACSGEIKTGPKPVDADEDGHSSETDCDDADPDINPDTPEICDGIDQNCDGQADEGVLTTYFMDADQDGFGDPNFRIDDCAQPQGYVTNGQDCLDSNPNVHPLSSEVCDELDNNCNSLVDEGVTTTFYYDADQDGYGGSEVELEACSPIVGFVDNSDDCDDFNAAMSPGAVEECDGIDNDCDEVLDNGLAVNTFYPDNDDDGYGDESGQPLMACAAPEGYAEVSGDCDDSDPDISPDAAEDCFDGIDNNCNAELDCEDILECMEIEQSCWVCGDGIVAPDEECDDGDQDDENECTNQCESNGGIFSACVNNWCYQSGTMDQYTKCDSVTDGGNTCVNPEIKYGTVTGGLPRVHPGNQYSTWCQQLGGAAHSNFTTGTRTGGTLFGCTSYDESTWHWCDWMDGWWYNQSLGYSGHTYNDYITSITCY